MVDCVVTKYPEVGYEMREYSSYDGRGEGAADHGSAVYTIDGTLVDTSGSVCPASWLMARRMEWDAASCKAQALTRAIDDLNKAVARGDKAKYIAGYRANVAHLS